MAFIPMGVIRATVERRVAVAVAAAAVMATSGAAVAAPPGTFEFSRVSEALQRQGISACEQPDWSTFSTAQDSKPLRDERARRSRIVVVAPQPCPAVDPETGDVYGEETRVVGVIDVRVYRSASALKRHGKDYTQGIGYAWHGNTLITLDPLPPPGMEQAFTAAMKDLGAQRKYVSWLWKEAHPTPTTTSG